MPIRNDIARSASAFTLVELILVMALLATLLAVSAPSLSRSFKQRGLDQEAVQLLAATEYARDEAVSQGVPMTVWIDPQSGSFGVHAKDGFEGDTAREKSYALKTDIRFDLAQAVTDKEGHVTAAEFDPEGTLSQDSLAAIRIIDRFDSGMSLTQTADGWCYEIAKP